MTIFTGRFGDAKPVNDKTAKNTTKTKPDYYHIFKHLKAPAENLKNLAGKTHEKYVSILFISETNLLLKESYRC